jgi:cytochrome b
VSCASPRIRVWDLPTRIFHWALVVLVIFSFTTGKIGGSWLQWHMKSGYAILALVLFRIVWGVAGSETSRFASFVRGPGALLRYAGDIAAKRRRPSIGHNPMGGWMVLFMLVLLLAQASSGLFADDEIATQGPLAVKVSNALVAKMSAFHYYNGWTLVAAVLLHVVAIATYWMAWRDNLVAPMWSGWREADVATAQPALRAAWIAAVILAMSAGLVYWLVVVYPRG